MQKAAQKAVQKAVQKETSNRAQEQSVMLWPKCLSVEEAMQFLELPDSEKDAVRKLIEQ